jgi:lysine-specific demethylase/histidyl-hydroxylase NO66
MSRLNRVAACDQQQFAAQHWGRTPLLSRAAELPSDFTDLFGTDAVDELVSERGLRTPFARMAKDGSVLKGSQFTRGGGAGAGSPDQLADDKVLRLLADGSTLVLQGVHRTWAPVMEFANGLAAELGHPVQVNAYITPPQNQGFAAHYDVHDVFVLQITGSKRWLVHEPVLRDPLPEQDWEKRRDEVAARAAQPPLMTEVLTPGDALYLPRGYLHSAQALGELSIHLTVGVHPITRYRLVRELLDAAREEPELRRSLPMGTDLGEPAALAAELADTIAALHAQLDGADLAGVAAAVGAELTRQTRGESLSPLAQLRAADELEDRTRLRLRHGLRARVSDSDGSVLLHLLDTDVTFPATAGAALKIVLDGAPFTVAELPGLDADERLVLGRRLLREGIVVPA